MTTKYPCLLSAYNCKYAGGKNFNYGSMRGVAAYCRFSKRFISLALSQMKECPKPATVKLTPTERSLLDYFIADWRDARSQYMDKGGNVMPERLPSERLYNQLLTSRYITEVAEMKEALSYALDMAETVGVMKRDKIAAFYALIERCDKVLEVTDGE